MSSALLSAAEAELSLPTDSAAEDVPASRPDSEVLEAAELVRDL